MKLSTIYSIVGILMLFVGVFATVGIHEAAHGIIMKEYGCEKVKYGIDWESPYTICDDDFHAETEAEKNLHLQIDVNDFVLMPMLIVIYFLLFTIGGILIMVMEKE